MPHSSTRVPSVRIQSARLTPVRVQHVHRSGRAVPGRGRCRAGGGSRTPPARAATGTGGRHEHGSVFLGWYAGLRVRGRTVRERASRGTCRGGWRTGAGATGRRGWPARAGRGSTWQCRELILEHGDAVELELRRVRGLRGRHVRGWRWRTCLPWRRGGSRGSTRAARSHTGVVNSAVVLAAQAARLPSAESVAPQRRGWSVRARGVRGPRRGHLVRERLAAAGAACARQRERESAHRRGSGSQPSSALQRRGASASASALGCRSACDGALHWTQLPWFLGQTDRRDRKTEPRQHRWLRHRPDARPRPTGARLPCCRWRSVHTASSRGRGLWMRTAPGSNRACRFGTRPGGH